jgi:hypothetical protein
MKRTFIPAASCRFSLLLAACVLAGWARNAAAAEQPDPSTPNESVKGQPAKVEGLAVTPVKITANVLGCMFWADKEGAAFWAVDGSGVIYNVSFPDLTITQKIDLGATCSWLAPSAQGFVASMPETKEIWLLNPRTFAVKKKIGLPFNERTKLGRAVSAASLSTAFASGNEFGDQSRGGIVQVDLSKGTSANLAPGCLPVVTADGKYLFFRRDKTLFRYHIRGAKAVLEQTAGIPGEGDPANIQTTVDSKFVALPIALGNGPNNAVNVYAVQNTERAAVILKSGGLDIKTIASDPVSGKFYAFRQANMLAFNKEGEFQKQYKLEPGDMHQMLVHPKGGKMLALGKDKFLLIELPTD